MNCLIVILALVVIAHARPHIGNDLELEEILSHRTRLIIYMKCTLEKGHCSSHDRKLKSLMEKALVTCCSICTETDRNRILRVLHHIISHEKRYSDQVFAKYDPHSKCLPQYESHFLKSSYKIH